MESNKVRAKLMRGEVSLGSWLNLASPMSAEMMAAAGFEWLVVDAEHSQWDIDAIAHAFRAIEARGAVPLVRTWTHDPSVLARLLDAGAMGIVAPHVSTPKQAEELAKAMRYPPRGERSAGTGRSSLVHPQYRTWIDAEVMVIPQIEDMEGVKNTQAIMSVDGVDVAFLGPNDLGLSMGIPPEQHYKDQRHLDAIAAVLEGAKKAGKPAGIPGGSPELVRQFIKQGFLMMALASDFRILQAAAAKWLQDAKA